LERYPPPILRRRTLPVRVGNLVIGGDAPVSVQSMLKCDPRDTSSCLRQLKAMEREGCELVRMAVPDMEAVSTLAQLVRKAGVPLIADVHFDHRLAIQAMQAGADKVRINPGNLSASGLRQVLRESFERNIPLRIGFNSGSLPRDLHSERISERLVEAANRFLQGLEIPPRTLIFSLKASSIEETLHAYQQFSDRYDYPLHIGLTEAGPIPEGIVTSVLACEQLLLRGIGDTLRISLTDSPLKEIRTARALLESIGIREGNVRIISCPTCGRTNIPLTSVLTSIRPILNKLKKPLVLAVMGCEVNGPGEAMQADLGIAITRQEAIFFKNGKIIRRVPRPDLLRCLKQELAPWE
jgi:(E)-4-hydroxy-3-methylbut-2-enyl-diphosphate synthase